MDGSFNIQAPQGGATNTIPVSVQTNPNGGVTFKTSSGEELSVQQLVEYVSASWGVNIDQQMNDKITDMQQKNNALKTANNVLSDLNNLKPSNDDDKKTIPAADVQWMNNNGLTPPVGDVDQTTWSQQIQAVSAKISAMNATSQVETIKLNQLNKDHAQIFEFQSNSAQLFSKTMLAIISNLRD